MSRMMSLSPMIGPSSIDPCNGIISTFCPLPSKKSLAILTYLVATFNIFLGTDRSKSPYPAKQRRHLANPKSMSSYTSLLSSISVSLPTTPTSATPCSTYIGTSLGLTKIKSYFPLLSLMTSFLDGSKIFLQSMPHFSSISTLFSASLPFASANVTLSCISHFLLAALCDKHAFACAHSCLDLFKRLYVVGK